MEYVNTLLVLHNDAASNKVNPATMQMLNMVDTKFAKAGTSVWEHVVIAYSKCNDFETTWRSGLDGKKREIQQMLRRVFALCDCDVPVLALGGAESSERDSLEGLADGEFDRLYKILLGSAALDTRNLAPFEGTAERFRKIVHERDSARARNKAVLIYGIVCLKLATLLLGLGIRHSMSFSVMRLVLLNPSSVLDEFLIFCAFAYCVGPMDLWNSLQIAVDEHVRPALEGLSAASSTPS